MSRSTTAAATARKKTKTKTFGTGKRESHDATGFYDRKLVQVDVSKDTLCNPSPILDEILCRSSEDMSDLVDNSVALMVTSPPYHVGKDYDADCSFEDYLALLRRVLAETHRVLEPGGRAVINVANLGRRPYVPLTSHVNMMMLELGFLMRGEIVWRKAKADSGSCAWGTWRKADNPVLRDVHEYLLVFSKGRFGRARKGESTLAADEFRVATTSVWDDIPPASAKRIGHPAPFPIELPGRLIRLYSFVDDLILDPFMGAGTTAIAALRNDRHYVGYETSQEYVALAAKRIEAERDEPD